MERISAGQNRPWAIGEFYTSVKANQRSLGAVRLSRMNAVVYVPV